MITELRHFTTAWEMYNGMAVEIITLYDLNQREIVAKIQAVRAHQRKYRKHRSIQVNQYRYPYPIT